MSATIHTMRSGDTLPPRLSCDALGICHHWRLNCNEGTCHKALLDDGQVDIPLHGTPAPLMDVTSPLTRGELIWYWSWVAATYAGIFGIGAVIYFFFSDAAVRAFWRVVGYFG